MTTPTKKLPSALPTGFREVLWPRVFFSEMCTEGTNYMQDSNKLSGNSGVPPLPLKCSAAGTVAGCVESSFISRLLQVSI